MESMTCLVSDIFLSIFVFIRTKESIGLEQSEESKNFLILIFGRTIPLKMAKGNVKIV